MGETGKLAGLTGLESIGMLAAGTQLGIGAEIGSTAVEATMLALSGDIGPQAQAIINRVGATEGDALDKVRVFAAAAQRGEISNAELEIVFGTEGLRFMGPLKDPESAQRILAPIDALVATRAEGSVAGGKTKGIVESSELQRYNLLAKQAASGGEFITSTDVGAARAEATRQLLLREIERAVSEGEITAPEGESFKRGMEHGLFRFRDEEESDPGAILEMQMALTNDPERMFSGPVETFSRGHRAMQISRDVIEAIEAGPIVNVTNIDTNYSVGDPTDADTGVGDLP